MKPLTLEKTKLKEEMKERCLAKGQYKDEKAKDKFKMLCHLEDFEVQYWELEKENKQLKIQISAREEVCNRLESNWNKLKEDLIKIRKLTFTKYNKNEWENCLSFNDDILPLIEKMKELERSDE